MCVVGKIHFRVKQGFYMTLFLLFLSRFHLKYTEIRIKKKINRSRNCLCVEPGRAVSLEELRSLSAAPGAPSSDGAGRARDAPSGLRGLLVRLGLARSVRAVSSSPGCEGFASGS